MTFKSFLVEDELGSIHQDCQKFIKESGGLPLYRGTSDMFSFKKVRKVPVRKNRVPRDTPRLIHDLMNEFFQDKFSVAARSEAVFASGNYHEAGEYGSVYYVLPAGHYDYLWGVEPTGGVVKDTYGLIMEFESVLGTTTREQLKRLMFDKLGDIHWRTTGLEEAIKQKAELMLFCDEIYLVSTSIPYDRISSGQV